MVTKKANEETKAVSSYREEVEGLNKRAVKCKKAVEAVEDVKFFTSRKNQIALKLETLKDEEKKAELLEQLEQFTVAAADAFVKVSESKK